MGFLSGFFSSKQKVKDVKPLDVVESLNNQHDSTSQSLDGLTGVAKYLQLHKDRPKVPRTIKLSGVDKYLINVQNRNVE